VLGFTPKGTHAHSMVQFFKAIGQDELAAFQAFAEVYPDDCLLLIDTVNTLESGVPNAIKVFEELRRKGHEPVGVRIDSGDLAYLSIQVARMLNVAGFPNTSIVLSNELDELVIWQIQTQIQEEASRYGIEPQDVLHRLVYGVGTNLVTSEGSPALGGVYKLVAVKQNNDWVPAIKISEMPLKTPNPGKKQGWRIYDQRGLATADLLSLDDEDPTQEDRILARHPSDLAKSRTIKKSDIGEIEPLLVDVLKEGKLVYAMPPIEEMRERRRLDIARLDVGVRRLLNPHVYHVSLTGKLWDLKQELIQSFVKSR
jgi:nicotinate phosphoribosyltransferase